MQWLDLFSGIGGFALGLQWAGFPPPVGFCEIDPFCRRVLAKHWPDVPIHSDIRELKADAVGPVDLICGGFPCQPWSHAGKSKGTADSRDLWPEMCRLIADIRPTWVLGENVQGFVSNPLGLDRALSDLEGLGYSCQAFCIPACAVNAPHRRQRVWIVARIADADDEDGAVGISNGRGRAARQQAGSAMGYGSAIVPASRSLGDAERSGVRATGGMADALGSGPQERVGERGDDGAQLQAAERGRGLGDAERSGNADMGRSDAAGSTRTMQSGRIERQWVRPDARQPDDAAQWNNAEWLWCEFDQRWRRVEPGLRLLAHGVSERVDKLRALGNAVVPQVVAEIGRAIREA